MFRPLRTILAAAVLVTHVGAFGQTEPAEQYLQCYFQIQEADKMRSEGKVVEAHDKFKEALERLQTISRDHPDWRQDLVRYRVRYCSDQIANLKGEADAKRGATGAAAPVATTPAAGGPPPTRLPRPGEEPLPARESAQAPIPVAPPQPMIDTTPPTPGPQPRPQILPAPKQPESQVVSVPETKRERPPQVATTMPEVVAPPAALPGAAATVAAPSTGDLSQKVAELSGQLQRTQTDLERAKAELGETHKQLKTALAERDDIRTRLDQASSELQAAKDKEDKRVAGLMKDNADLKTKLQDAEAQIAALKSSDAQNAVKSLQAQLDATKEQLARAQQENKVYEETTRGLKQQLEAMQAKLAESESKAKVAGASPETSRLMEENEVLRAVVDRQLKEQARREAAKKLAFEELKNLEIQSDVLAKQIDILASPLVELSANEIAMLRLTVPPSGAEGAAIAEPLDGTAPKPEKAKVTDSVPPDMAPIAKQARLFFDKGNYDAAAEQYRQILARYPENLYALSNLGVVRFQQGKFKDAEEALQRAIKVAPNDGFSHSILGIVFYMTARFDEAVSTLTRAATLDPNDPQTHNYLGIACSRKGWQQVAEQEVRKAIELNPNYGDAHFNLAVIYATQNPPAKEMARRHYKSATQLGLPQDPELEKLLK